MAGEATPAAEAEDVLGFWLDDVPASKRFIQDDALDGEVAQRFGSLHASLSQGVPASWQTAPRPMLAAIVVLDQFSRNLFRNDRRAFAQDARAVALARTAIDSGFDQGMSSNEKQFLYMPFMHSERLADVERSIVLMHDVGLDDAEAFARRHAAVIARCGRYPSRNAALGRETTPAEAAFLADNPMGF
ncbi:MAG: DUF924 family protein [Alteraurantiacibacter sp.]